MRIVVMGTGGFVVPAFKLLLESDHDILAVVTRPEKLARGGRRPPPNPMRQAVDGMAVPILDPANVNDEAFVKQLSEMQPDLLVVCDFGQILSVETLSTATLGGINLHGSLLPAYRGAAPVQWAIINGDPVSGITVIHMTPRLDGGPALLKIETEIQPDESAVDLENRLAEMGAPAVLDSIAMLENWDRSTPIGESQDDTLSTRAPRLAKSDGNIDWNATTAEILNRHRGVQPWPGSFTFCNRENGKPLRLLIGEIRPVDGVCGEPGSFIDNQFKELWIATDDGMIAIEQVQPAGKRTMTAEEFLRGYQIKPGTLFSQSSNG